MSGMSDRPGKPQDDTAAGNRDSVVMLPQDQPSAAIRDAVYRIAITGHRPGSLREPSGLGRALEPLLPEFFARAAARAKAIGATTVEVITGGALGVDQELAVAVHRARADREMRWRSVIVLPFPVEIMATRWSATDRARLGSLVAEADEIIGPISPVFAPWAYHARNAVMVDRAAVVVAFWNGKRTGGTHACINYALRRARPPRPVYNALSGFAPVRLADIEQQTA